MTPYLKGDQIHLESYIPLDPKTPWKNEDSQFQNMGEITQTKTMKETWLLMSSHFGDPQGIFQYGIFTI